MRNVLTLLIGVGACLFGSVSLSGERRAPADGFSIPAALGEAQRVARGAGASLWPGYGSVPFSFLLIRSDAELLFCHPSMPPGFGHAGRDLATGCSIVSRPRTALPAHLLAAMPIFGPASTIVMGSPQATGRTEANWKRTVLHEHFHQWQASLPGYYTRVAALDLTGGDQTGMWMINYPFPYDDPAAGRAYEAASLALADALERRGQADFLASFDRYLRARRAFASAVSPEDWRYLEFQLWQEGTARWTEIELGRAHPDRRVRADTQGFERETLMELRSPDLKTQGRLLAYPLGAGEAMLMQSCGASWRRRYPHVLGHGDMLIQSRSGCRRRQD